jgi:hypothetical protein
MSISPDKMTTVFDRSVNDAAESRATEMQQELSFLGYLTSEQRLCLPDWLVVAPPKTGTSWLYANLREHSELFVPKIKELKYFSHRFESDDLRCYLDHFREGLGKSKGEVSPSYSMLPRRTIRLIRRLMPDLKVIYLMRDPIERAWSHARHSFRQGEANFKGRFGAIDDVTDEEWIVNLRDDWNRLSSDYLGQLERWRSVFPREQVYVGFFEDLTRSPRTFLRHVLEFLAVDPDFADSSAVTLDAVNVGLPREVSPRLNRHLQEMYAERTAELAGYLDREFQLRVPVEWEQSFGGAIEPKPLQAAAGSQANQPENGAPPADRPTWEVDDDTLARLLARDDLLAMDFLGFNIVRRGAGFMAYRITLGVARPDDFDLSWWREQSVKGNCHFADNPYELKSMILRQTLCRDAPPGSELSRLRHVELQFDRLFRRQAEIEAHFTKLKQDMSRVFEPLELLVRRQAEMEAQLGELKQVVARGLEPLAPLVHRQADTEARLTELKRVVFRRIEPIDFLRASQARLEGELTRCQSQLHDFRTHLRSARRRLKKLSRNRIIRALRWLDVCLPRRRSQDRCTAHIGTQTVGHIIVGEEARVGSAAVGDKPMLPAIQGSVISRADRLKPVA